MDLTDLLARLTARFGPAVTPVEPPPAGTTEGPARVGDGCAVARVERAHLREVLAFCRDADGLRFDMLTDLTAVDYLRYPGRDDQPRFEVVYHLYSVAENHRLRLKVAVDEDELEVPSAVVLWPIANWFEREVWDMFGIRFEGHPDLRRLLLYEEFQGHPLRKDYPVNRRQPLIGPRN
jgi:NADH-quinone oxidoreductase subunit C